MGQGCHISHNNFGFLLFVSEILCGDVPVSYWPITCCVTVPEVFAKVNSAQFANMK